MENQKQSLIPSAQHSVTKTTEDLGGKSVQQSHSMAAEMVSVQSESEVKAGFALAQLNPRNEERARVGIVTSCKNLRFAEKCVYKKPVGSKKVGNRWEQNYVEGLSIRFAEEMLRHWGNVKIQHITIYDDPKRRMVRVICYDLQANLPYGKDILIEKTVERKNSKGREVVAERTNSRNEVVFVVVATEDEVAIKEAALVSKAIRNNGLRLIPSHILEEAKETALSTVEAGVDSDPMAVMRKILNSFQLLGISVEEIEKYLGHKIDQMTTPEIVNLQSIYNTIKAGESRWADYLADGETSSGPEKAEIDPSAGADWDKLNENIKKGDESTHTSVEDKQGK